MSKRSNWCDFSKDTAKYIKKRDNDSCVICGKKGGALQIMHVFISRAQGGKGSKENGVLGCTTPCHRIMDNPLGKEENLLSIQYNNVAKNYLIEREQITIGKDFVKSLKYQKEVCEFVKIPVDWGARKEIKRCEECRFIRKNKFNNSSIPSYFCIVNKKIVSRKKEICTRYKEGGSQWEVS